MMTEPTAPPAERVPERMIARTRALSATLPSDAYLSTDAFAAGAVMPRGLVRRLFLFVAFVGPVAYVAVIGSVAIHEVIGHGCTALLLGGSFDGFAILPDGMGWAATTCPDHDKLMRAGGVVATAAIGLLMLLIGPRWRSPFFRVSFLVLGTCCVADGLAYSFWNSLFPRPPGDLGRILADGNALLRWSIVVASGVGYVAALTVCNIVIFRCVEDVAGGLPMRAARIVAWGGFGMIGGGCGFMFDWNQIILDVGLIPPLAGGLLQLSMAPLLVKMSRRDVEAVRITPAAWTIAVSVAWTTFAAVLVALCVWLRHGVRWDGLG